MIEVGTFEIAVLAKMTYSPAAPSSTGAGPMGSVASVSKVQV